MVGIGAHKAYGNREQVETEQLWCGQAPGNPTFSHSHTHTQSHLVVGVHYFKDPLLSLFLLRIFVFIFCPAADIEFRRRKCS